MRYKFLYLLAILKICLISGSPLLSEVIVLQDTSAPVPTWTLCCDGSVKNGFVKDLPDDGFVRSNLGTIIFDADSSYNYKFKYDNFIPGVDRTAKWTLDVIDPLLDARAIIIFSDKKGNDTTIQIDYHPFKLEIKPAFTDFGLFKSGEMKTLDFWVVNQSDKFSATVYDIGLKMSSKGFIINLPKLLPWSINKKDSVKFYITFNATDEGKFEDSVGIGDNCLFFYKAKVQARVEYPLIYVWDVNFDNTPVGKTVTNELYIKNTGNVPLVIIGYNNNSFAYSTDLPVQGVNNPEEIAPNEIKIYHATFSPYNSGKYSGTIEILSDAGTYQKNICYLTGEAKQIKGIENENENLNLKILNLYPEPSTSLITIETNLNDIISAEIQITDIAGRMIKSLNTDLSKETKFDFSSLSEGVYLMKIKAGRETLIKKFTIKR